MNKSRKEILKKYKENIKLIDKHNRLYHNEDAHSKVFRHLFFTPDLL